MKIVYANLIAFTSVDNAKDFMVCNFELRFGFSAPYEVTYTPSIAITKHYLSHSWMGYYAPYIAVLLGIAGLCAALLVAALRVVRDVLYVSRSISHPETSTLR